MKEKAKELVNKFYQPLGYLDCQVSSNEMWNYSKISALILVEEVQNALTQADVVNEGHWVYWEEMKAEINLL